jgi:probable F420-dependent oxidoreductase
MKVDGGISQDLDHAGASARDAEAAGYDGVWCPETAHDPFRPVLLAAEHRARAKVGTNIAVAFARNPMTLANIGYDLNKYSQGRFVLGLGSQIKAHITKRFSMEWSDPAPRMREMISAIKAIWGAWNDGTKLEIRGDFYQHTLMTPFFDPGPNPYGNAQILLAGVGELMTEVAGEVADGFLCHGFTTESYLRAFTLPALERWTGEIRAVLGHVRHLGFGVRCDRRQRGGVQEGRRRRAPADLLLRFDTGLPWGA